MTKVQYGANDNLLDGWINFRSEHDGDITRPLKFADNSVDVIFAEHVVEHVTPKQAWNFLDESLRILKPGGVIRVIVPAVDRIWRLADRDYRQFMTENAPQWFANSGLPIPQLPISDKDIVKAIVFCHHHQSVWTWELLEAFMEAVGFRVSCPGYGKSEHPELQGVDSHWRLLGLNRCVIESAVVEGTKL